MSIPTYLFSFIEDLYIKDFCLRKCCSEVVSGTIYSPLYKEWLMKVHSYAKFLIVHDDNILGCAAV